MQFTVTATNSPRIPIAIRCATMLTVLGVFLPSNIVTAAEPTRPNVLLIISDDLNNFLGCYDDPRARTPNLDRLAARGVLFERAYCTFPLCGPSRNSLLTGLYPNSTGIYQNNQIFRQTVPQHLSLPQAFRQQGYFAARLGKLYHYGVPGSVGTSGDDDPASWELQMNPAGIDRLGDPARIFSLVPGQFGGTLSWYASPHGDEQHTDGILANDADWVLERCAADRQRPFFLAVGFFRPHTPYVAPRDPYFGYYPAADMPVVTGIEADRADLPAAAVASGKAVQDRMSDELRRQAVQAYYASISFMDTQVGRVVDALDRLELSDDTIIVFTSDHGYHMGEHGLWQKMSLFEESLRVPLLVVAPGVTTAGAVVRQPVSQVDLYPTLAQLCGVEPAATLQGESLVPVLKDPTHAARGWALSQVNRGQGNKRYFGYSLRTDRWRYTEWDGGDAGRELYDHDNDPRELTNLAEDPAHAAEVQRLSQLLRDAVGGSFPESGTAPKVRNRRWYPKLDAAQ